MTRRLVIRIIPIGQPAEIMTTPQRSWSVSYELEDTGQTAVFDESNAELVVLNETAGAIWSLIDGQRSVQQISELLTELAPQGTPREQIERDLTVFLKQMEERGAIHWNARPPTVETPGSP